jgi:ribonuclease HII
VQIWYDTMIEDWTEKIAKGAKVAQDVHVHLGMSKGYFERWQSERPAFVLGSDEVGYGAVAGPLVVCSVIASFDWDMRGLRDSKMLSPDKIADLYDKLRLQKKAGKIQFTIVDVPSMRIDELGAVAALRKAHAAALETSRKDTLVVVDGALDLPFECAAIPKADTFIPQVMAASIIAKHLRDNLMRDMDGIFPGYGFMTNMGYKTQQHAEALRKLGPCEIHRECWKDKDGHE